MKRTPLALLLLLIISGCVSTLQTPAPQPQPLKWVVNLTSYRLTQTITATMTSWEYSPPSGYQLLLVSAQITNNQNIPDTIDWYRGDMATYISSTGVQYNLKLIRAPVGQVPLSYEPNQSQTGYLIFEIPAAETNINAGKLLISFAGQDSTTISLTGLPPEAPAQ